MCFLLFPAWFRWCNVQSTGLTTLFAKQRPLDNCKGYQTAALGKT